MACCFSIRARNPKNIYVSPITVIPVNYGAYLWHNFYCRCVSSETRDSQLDLEADNAEDPRRLAHASLSQWLKINAEFPIQGKPLKEWAKERNSKLAPLMRVMDSSLAILYLILLIIISMTPIIAVFILAKTTGRDVYDNLKLIVPIACFFISAPEVGLYTRYRALIKDERKKWDNDLMYLAYPGKKLIVADKGFVGMVGENVEKGDELFYLLGSLKPVVLRRVRGSGNGDGRKCYTVMGQCYIHLRPKDKDTYLRPRKMKLWKEWEREAERNLIKDIELI